MPPARGESDPPSPVAFRRPGRPGHRFTSRGALRDRTRPQLICPSSPRPPPRRPAYRSVVLLAILSARSRRDSSTAAASRSMCARISAAEACARRMFSLMASMAPRASLSRTSRSNGLVRCGKSNCSSCSQAVGWPDISRTGVFSLVACSASVKPSRPGSTASMTARSVLVAPDQLPAVQTVVRAVHPRSPVVLQAVRDHIADQRFVIDHQHTRHGFALPIRAYSTLVRHYSAAVELRHQHQWVMHSRAPWRPPEHRRPANCRPQGAVSGLPAGICATVPRQPRRVAYGSLRGWHSVGRCVGGSPASRSANRAIKSAAYGLLIALVEPSGIEPPTS